MIFRITNQDKTHFLHVRQGMMHHGPESGEPDGRWRWRITDKDELTLALSPVYGWESHLEALSNAQDFLAGIGAKCEEEVHDG